MEIYKAIIEKIEQYIGSVTQKLKIWGKTNNTLIMFVSSNDIFPDGAINAKGKSKKLQDYGTVSSYLIPRFYGAFVQYTHLQKWKAFSPEIGVRTSNLVSEPAISKNIGNRYNYLSHVTDTMFTLLELKFATYIEVVNTKIISDMQEVRPLSALKNRPLKRSNPLYLEFFKDFTIGDVKNNRSTLCDIRKRMAKP